MPGLAILLAFVGLAAPAAGGRPGSCLLVTGGLACGMWLAVRERGGGVRISVEDCPVVED